MSAFVDFLTQISADRPMDVFPKGVWWFGRGYVGWGEWSFSATQRESEAQWICPTDEKPPVCKALQWRVLQEQQWHTQFKVFDCEQEKKQRKNEKCTVFPLDDLLVVWVWYFISISQTYNMYATGSSRSGADMATKAQWHVALLSSDYMSGSLPKPHFQPDTHLSAALSYHVLPWCKGADKTSTPVPQTINGKHGCDSSIWSFFFFEALFAAWDWISTPLHGVHDILLPLTGQLHV